MIPFLSMKECPDRIFNIEPFLWKKDWIFWISNQIVNSFLSSQDIWLQSYPIFYRFSRFRVQLTNPVTTDFLKTTIRKRKWWPLTKYAVSSPYMEENIVNYSKNCQKTAIFDDFWRFSDPFTQPCFFGPWRHRSQYFPATLI